MPRFLAALALVALALIAPARALDAFQATTVPGRAPTFCTVTPNALGLNRADGLLGFCDAAANPVVMGRALYALESCTPAERADIVAYTGALDAGRCLRAAVARAATVGRPLRVDAGLWNIKSGRIPVPMGVAIEGEGWGELPTSTPNHGTVINFDYLATTDPYGFYVVGSGAAIRNLEIAQTQPAPATGWQPRVGPWAIYAYAAPYADDGGHRLAVERVMLRNVYDGINTGITRGGYFREIYGQPFHRGIRVEANVDEPHFADIHLGWTYWSGHPDVIAWEHGNLVALDFLRVDNPQLTNVFTFNAATGLQCSQRTDAYNPGNCNLLTASNMGHDNVGIGVLVRDGGSLNLTNFYCYADSGLPQSSCLKSIQDVATNAYEPARIQITGADLSGSGTSALQFAWAPTQSKATVHQITNVRIRSFDAANGNNAAISAVDGVTVQRSNLVVEGTTNPARIFSGAGKLVLPAGGAIGTAGWTELSNGMLSQWGTNAANASVTFPRACPSTVVSLTATAISAAAPGGNATESVTTSPPSLTGFTAYSRIITAGTVSSSSSTFYWQVLCY